MVSNPHRESNNTTPQRNIAIITHFPISFQLTGLRTGIVLMCLSLLNKIDFNQIAATEQHLKTSDWAQGTSGFWLDLKFNLFYECTPNSKPDTVRKFS